MRIFVFTMQMRLQNQKLKIWQIKQKARGKPCMNFSMSFSKEVAMHSKKPDRPYSWTLLCKSFAF